MGVALGHLSRYERCPDSLVLNHQLCRRRFLPCWYMPVIYLFILFFGNSPTGQTCRQIFTHDGSNYVNSHTGVLFRGFGDIDPHLVVKFPQNPNFEAVSRCFQAKRAKY